MVPLFEKSMLRQDHEIVAFYVVLDALARLVIELVKHNASMFMHTSRFVTDALTILQ